MMVAIMGVMMVMGRENANMGMDKNAGSNDQLRIGVQDLDSTL